MNTKAVKNWTSSVIAMAASINLASGIIGILMNDIIDTYRLTEAQSGMMSSIFSIGSFLSVALALFFRSRLTKPVIVLAGGFVLAFSQFFSGLPIPYALFLVMCLLGGVGNGSTDAFLDAFLADLHPKDTGRYLGAKHGIFAVAGILSPVLIAAALKVTDWRAVYRIVGLLAAANIGVFAYMFFRHRGSVKESGYVEAPLRREDAAELIRPRFIALAAGMFLLTAGQVGITVWVVRYVSTYLGQPGIAALCLSMFWLAGMVSRFIMPRIKARTEVKILVGAIGGSITWTIGVLAGTGAAMLACCFLTGLLAGSLLPLNISIGTSMFPEKTGMVTAMLTFMKNLGSMVSPIIVGSLLTRLPARTAILTAAVMYFLTGCTAFVLCRIRR